MKIMVVEVLGVVEAWIDKMSNKSEEIFVQVANL